MKKVFWIKPVFFAAILLLIACKKEKTYLDSGELEYKVTHWPVVKTLYVTNLTSATATLNGTVNGYGLPTTVTFEYSTGTDGSKGDISTSYSNTVIASQSPVADTGIINISANISGLCPCQVYHFRIKAENSVWKNFYGDQQSFSTLIDSSLQAILAPILFNPNLTYGTVSDIDGNSYKTIQIGDQVWMAENLRTTHYADGTPIPLVTDNWPYYANINRDKAYCWFNNDSASNATTYGALYTWAAAMNGYPSLPGPYGVQGVCPTGWHLPSDEEWTTLTDYLGGIDVAGAKLMETGTIHWHCPNTIATNESGFTALPGGRHPYGGLFSDIRDLGFWWSTKEYSCGRWYWCILSYANDTIEMFSNCSAYQEGYSVRCLKGIPIGVLTTMPATNLSSTGATLNGSVPASNLSTTVTFEYGTSTSYGQEVTADQSPVTGDLITDVSATLTGLTRSTIYNYRVKTVNSLGTSYGGNMEFDVTQKPTLSTTSITDITSTTAISGGNITDDGGAPVTDRGVFYSIYPITSFSYGAGSTRHTLDGPGSGSFTSKLTGLQPSTTYYVRSYAYNSIDVALGDMITFTTSTQAPTATTKPITNKSETGATLNGNVNASNLSTKVTFEYGTTTSYGQEVTAEQSPVTGYADINVSATLTGLMEGTYHFRVKAENSFWTVFGSDIQFTICHQFPIVTTLAATNIYSNGAILNGTVNANGSSTTVTFEYRIWGGGEWRNIPAKQSPVTGTTLTNVSANVYGLKRGTTHPFRVKAENSCGTVYGAIMSFTLQ